jgi:hypothetical protein
MTPRVGRATVRVVGVKPANGVAFVRIGEGEEVRVRWHNRGQRVRWLCDAHPAHDGCTHTRAVTWHLTGAAMKEAQA